MQASQAVLMVKKPQAHSGDVRDINGLDLWVGKIPWRRAWQPTPAFLPGESHGQGSLGGRPQSTGRKELEMTEVTQHACTVYVHPGVHCSTVYNRQDMRAT